MFVNFLIVFALMCAVSSAPQVFETKSFKVGIEYDHSLPMRGGSDRYRHRNNCDPFFVTITASVKNGYVISYLEVSTTVDEGGEVDFHVVRGGTGHKNMVFQIVSNHSDFLQYSYLTYGIKEDEYKKISNIIQIPVANKGQGIELNVITLITLSTLIFVFILLK